MIRSDPRTITKATFKGVLSAQIAAFKDGLAEKKLPENVYLIMDGLVLKGKEAYASMTVSDGTIEFVLEALTKRHVEAGFRHVYVVTVSPDGAIKADLLRAPNELPAATTPSRGSGF